MPCCPHQIQWCANCGTVSDNGHCHCTDDCDPPQDPNWQPFCEQWGAYRDMARSPKDGTTILARFRSDLVEAEGRDDLDRYAGQWIVIRHPGLAHGGYDIGWCHATPSGCGGFPDNWFFGWVPLPTFNEPESLQEPIQVESSK